MRQSGGIMGIHEIYSRKRPSFCIGIGRIFDFSRSLSLFDYKPNGKDPDIEDFLALRSDWKAVGDDMRSSMAQISELR